MTAASKGRKARNAWVQIAPGVRSRKILESPAATTRRIERNIQRDTCGLGHWREPSDWCTEPFSHTVTMVADVMGHMGGWQIYNSGVLVTLAVHPIEGPFTRGAPYVWCKAAHNRNGTSGVYPTAPVFGRFISQTPGGPKVLAGKGKAAVVGAEYVYCFRAVGMIGRDADLYTRSEIPTPIPTATERQEQPAAFDLLEHGVKALDNALQAMANVIELIDDVDDADKRSDNDKYLDRRYRKAQAYEALDHLLTTALDKSATLQRRVADYHKASPELAHWLARWQSEDAKA